MLVQRVKRPCCMQTGGRACAHAWRMLIHATLIRRVPKWDKTKPACTRCATRRTCCTICRSLRPWSTWSLHAASCATASPSVGPCEVQRMPSLSWGEGAMQLNPCRLRLAWHESSFRNMHCKQMPRRRSGPHRLPSRGTMRYPHASFNPHHDAHRHALGAAHHGGSGAEARRSAGVCGTRASQCVWHNRAAVVSQI